MGFFSKKKIIEQQPTPGITPVTDNRPVAVVVSDESVPTPVVTTTSYEDYEDYENRGEDEIEEPIPDVQPEIVHQQKYTPLPSSNMTEEEEIEKMQQEINRKKKELADRKLQEKILEEKRRQAQLAQQSSSQNFQQPIYLSEAEMLRAIKMQVDNLTLWAGDLTSYLKTKLDK